MPVVLVVLVVDMVEDFEKGGRGRSKEEVRARRWVGGRGKGSPLLLLSLLLLLQKEDGGESVCCVCCCCWWSVVSLEDNSRAEIEVAWWPVICVDIETDTEDQVMIGWDVLLFVGFVVAVGIDLYNFVFSV